MPDELTLEPEIDEGWEASGELIPSGMRRAASGAVPGSKLFNRLMSIILYRLKWLYDLLMSRVYWTDVTEFIFGVESSSERPPQLGVLRGQSGAILRTAPSKEEPVYLRARAKFSHGAVRLLLTSDGTAQGDAVIAVGLSESLDGPWTYFYGASPWTFDSSQKVQAYEIPTQDLEVGKMYYYRIVRQSGGSLSAPVLLAGVSVR